MFYIDVYMYINLPARRSVHLKKLASPQTLTIPLPNVCYMGQIIVKRKASENDKNATECYKARLCNYS